MTARHETAGGRAARNARRSAAEHRAPLRKRRAALGALLIAVTIPSVAEPMGLDILTAHAFGIGAQPQTLTPMPFERADMNFPGSAFYYVEDIPGLTYDIDELRSDEAIGDATIRFAESRDPGVAAPAFQSAGTALDKARALQCLSMAVYYEAASESYEGQKAVAQVVLNRVAHPSYPASVCGVVFQGSERSTGCQFTFTCDGSLARKPSRRSWASAQSVALSALSGDVFPAVGTATHYHTHAVNPYWASSLDLIGAIGAHRFYRWKGQSGDIGAFTMSYSGGEPVAAPNARAATQLPPAPPAAGPRGHGEAIPPSQSEAFAPAPGSGPIEAAKAPKVNDRLPASGAVKPEYRNSGRWLREPGG